MAGGGDAGSGPDNVAAARETGEAAKRLNEAQTYANRPNQNNSWGSTSWENTPEWDAATGQYVNQWTQNETLNPLLQQQVDSNMRIDAGRAGLAEGAMARAYDDYSTPMDFDQFGDSIKFDPNQYGQAQNFNLDDYGQSQNFTPGSQSQDFNLGQYGNAEQVGAAGNLQDFDLGQYGDSQRYNAGQYGNSEDFRMDDYGRSQRFDQGQYGDMQQYGQSDERRQAAEDASYGRQTSRLDPQFQQQEEALMSKLRSQGLTQGDRAYDKAVDNFSRGRNDAYEQARMGSTAEGRTETQLGMSQNELQNQNRWQEGQWGQSVNQQNNNTRSNDISQGMDANRLNEQNRMNDARLGMDEMQANNAARQGDITQGMQAALFNNQNITDQAGLDRQRIDANNATRQDDIGAGLQANQLNEQNRLNDERLGMDAMDQNNQARLQDAQLGMGAVDQANQTRQDELNLGFQNNEYQNALRSQDMGEAQMQRDFNLTEAERLRLGTGVDGGPPTSGGQTETIANKYVGGGTA